MSFGSSYMHFLTLKSICHLSAQSVIASRSFCNLLLHTVLMHLNILVSSANFNTWPCTFSCNSFINIKNSKGPSTEPCGKTKGQTGHGLGQYSSSFCKGASGVLHTVWSNTVIFSERELMFMFAICRRPSVCLSSVCLSSVCLSVVCRLSSVTFVHPTQAIEIFGNVSMPFGTLAICDLSVKILRRSSQGNPSGEGLNQRGAAKYSDLGPFQGHISETVQDRS